jgi:hypothetical protein
MKSCDVRALKTIRRIYGDGGSRPPKLRRSEGGATPHCNDTKGSYLLNGIKQKE